jgi:hypothetical protein
MTITATPEQIPAIVNEAQSAAYAAAMEYFRDKLGGRDQFACGFAWVNIYGVKGNTKIGRALKECNIRPSYTGGLQMYNPSNFGCQNVDTLEAGAAAAAAVFKKYGFEAYAGSRLD